MDTESIRAMFKKDDVERLLRKEEIDEMCEKFKLPFPGIKEVIDLINKSLETRARIFLRKVKIYECFIPLFFTFLENSFIRGLEEPGCPIGPRTSDAVGQQATQTLLNTFHQAGQSKSGGPEGIRENIGISRKRKAPYTYLSFLYDYYTMEEAIELKKEFTGVSVASIALSILPIEINIDDHIIDIEQINSIEDGKYLSDQGCWWWYSDSNLDAICRDTPRVAARIKLDVAKLFEFEITVTMIANVISKYDFPISKSTSTSKEDKEKFKVICVTSPTYEGIIDLFVVSEKGASPDDYKKDFFLTAAITSGEFKSIIITGIEGLQIFQPVSNPTLSIVRDIEEVEDGALLYLKNVRYSCIPISKLIKLINEAGLETDKYDVFNENKLEFHSHKIVKENRSLLKIQAKMIDERFDGTYQSHYVKGKKTTSEAPTNRFFELEESEDVESATCMFLLRRRPNKYFFDTKKKVEIENLKQLEDIISECNEGNVDIIEEFVGPMIDDEYNLFTYIERGTQKKRNFAAFTVQTSDQKLYYVCVCKIVIRNYIIRVNLDFVNSSINCSKLNDVINSFFSESEFSIPDVFRLPEIETLEVVEDELPSLFIRSKIFFRDELDPYDSNGKRLTKTPIERFNLMINNNVTDVRLLKHVYAETQGFALENVSSHPLVDPQRTFCNDFYSMLDLYGIDGLYTLLAYELIDMVNKEGYINVEYPKLVAATTTANGVNPMTSQGVISQKRGILSQITFDNSTKYISESSRLGKSESTINVSTGIFIGNETKIGTGYVDVRMNELKTSISSPVRNYTELGFKVRDDEEDPYYEEPQALLEIKKSKFPPVKWVIENFVSRDIFYYVDCGIANLCSIMKRKMKTTDPKKYLTNVCCLFEPVVKLKRTDESNMFA